MRVKSVKTLDDTYLLLFLLTLNVIIQNLTLSGKYQVNTVTIFRYINICIKTNPLLNDTESCDRMKSDSDQAYTRLIQSPFHRRVKSEENIKTNPLLTNTESYDTVSSDTKSDIVTIS